MKNRVIELYTNLIQAAKEGNIDSLELREAPNHPIEISFVLICGETRTKIYVSILHNPLSKPSQLEPINIVIHFHPESEEIRGELSRILGEEMVDCKINPSPVSVLYDRIKKLIEEGGVRINNLHIQAQQIKEEEGLINGSLGIFFILETDNDQDDPIEVCIFETNTSNVCERRTIVHFTPSSQRTSEEVMSLLMELGLNDSNIKQMTGCMEITGL
jgi:hypothetical protein